MKYAPIKFRLVLAVVAGLTVFTHYAHGQDTMTQIGTPLSVGSVINSAENGIEDILDLAFDRLDAALMAAVMEARATINASRLQFSDLLSTSINDLDGQQRLIIDELINLSDAVQRDLLSVAKEVRDGTNQSLIKIRMLLSKNPGAIFVVAKPAVVDSEFFEIEVTGTALSNAQVDEFRVSVFPVTPKITQRDDRKIIYRVDMSDLHREGIISGNITESVELLVSFSFIKESWPCLPPFCSPNRRSFTTIAVILPTILGEVRAVFSTRELKVENRSQTSAPFISERVKSRLKWNGIRYGRRTDVWVASPSDGWKIDLTKIKPEIEFNLLFDGCSGSRSNASFIEKTEHILRVRARTATDRIIGVTCKTKTIIVFNEWRAIHVRGELTTDFKQFVLNSTVELRLDDNYKRARLSHLEIRSPMFQNHTQIYLISEIPPQYSVEYKKSTQSVYFTAKYTN